MKTIALIPAKDEALCIGELIDNLKKYVDKVIVIDGNSSDRTSEIVKSHGAELFNGDGNGKGHDLKLFQKYARDQLQDFDIFVMLDGDMSYNPDEIENLINPIKNNEADVVIGSRFDKIKPKKGSIRRFNRFGNFLLTKMAGFLYQRSDITDVASGYWAFSKDFIANASLASEGWDLEINLLGVAAKNYRLKTVPIRYRPRMGHSKLNLLGTYKLPLHLCKYFALDLLRSSKSLD